MDVLRRNNVNVMGNASAGQTIMFGHGFGTDQTSFYDVLKYFEADYKIVLYDNVGGGKSDIDAFSTSKYQTLFGYVNDLIEIFQVLALKEVIYVGHSVNGMVGLLTAIKHPEYFKHLILLGASPRYLNDPAANYVGGFNQSDLDGLYHAMTTNYASWVSGFSKIAMGNPDRPALSDIFASTLSSLRPDIAQFVARAIFQSDHRDDITKVGVPVLVIQTTEDIAVPEVVGDYLCQHIPHAKLVIVKSKGHFPHISAPTEVAASIKAYIEA